MKKGKFLVLEGIDGAGKTTFQKKIITFLKKKGVKDIIVTREPGSTPLSEKLRYLIKYSVKKETITDQAEILMLYAARVQLLETIIKPSLIKGIWVIGDRHDLSSHTYQICKNPKSKKLIFMLKKNLLNGFEPDLTLYLDIKPKIGIKRIYKRGKIDFFEKKYLKLLKCIRNRYLKYAYSSKNIHVIDTSQNLKKVFYSIKKILEIKIL